MEEKRNESILMYKAVKIGKIRRNLHREKPNENNDFDFVWFLLFNNILTIERYLMPSP